MTSRNPWHPLYALVVGFFMITLDTTIVGVANPAILVDLRTDIDSVIWVTSAYLLAFVVPLLVAGRLGDRFGPKNLYLVGLALFTVASLWCGLSGTIDALIAARAAQGLGAAIMTPQTMAVITRTFPPGERGAPMGVWGGVAGLASLVGPVLGGVLVDQLGWEWIFFVNLPIGVIAFVLAVRLVPRLPVQQGSFDLVGVVISAIGVICLVVGIQEGNRFHWSVLIWALIGAGVVVLVAFVGYEARIRNNRPLLPLSVFRDRNFALSNIGICIMAAAITWLILSGFLYLQSVRGMSPTKSALVFAPLAVVTGVLAPFMGKLSDRIHPRWVPGCGFALYAVSLFWFSTLMRPDTPVIALLVPIAVMGVANACIWAPLPAIANHNLPLHMAGAGSGVYNTIRQLGSVLGSAVTGALITTLLASKGFPGASPEAAGGEQATGAARDALSAAISESALFPSILLATGAVVAGFFGGASPVAEASVNADAREETRR